MPEGSRAMQYFSALAVTLTMVFQGVILAWPSPVLPKLLNGQTEITINKEQCSWMISLIMAGGIPGCIASQYLADIIGRKKTILATSIPCILGSVMIVLATVPWVLYIARTICGFGGGMIVVVVSIYIAEIADKEIRGALGTLLQSMANVGNLLMYTVGPFVSYTTLNGIVLAIPLVCLTFCIWIPESPYFCLKEGNVAGAEKAIKKLKGLKDIKPLESELMNMKAQIKKDMERKTTVTELLTKPEYRKAVIVVAGLKALQQMTGAIVIQSYLETIFRQTSMNITGQVASIIYGVVQIFAGFVATVLVDRAGRKPLLFLSSLGTGIALTLVGIYFFMQDYLKLDDEIMSTVSLLPIVGIVGFNILYVIGIGNLPYVMQAELFPTNVKSAASSTATMAGALLAFIVTKTYQGLADTAGIYTVFWMFASISYAGVFFVFFFVPETKGKSLLGIQEKLQRQRKIPKENNNVPEAIPLQSA